MQRIRLLTSVQGDDPVFGDVNDELDVDDAVAAVWADGERAELVTPAQPLTGHRTRVRPARAATRTSQVL